jgi:uncharacterized protein with PIN domain
MHPSFAVEKTLGRLAKWLRLMGFDTLLETDFPSAEFAGRIHAPRIFLTRTLRALRRASAFRMIFIHDNDPMRQLAEVVRQTAITFEDLKPFSRCVRCNEPTVVADVEAIRPSVPDYVQQTHDAFSRCPRCGRIYWRGSHTTRSLERIQSLFKEV